MDFSSVQGKVAVVTGASRGIGEAIARVYAEHGMKVVCAARGVEAGEDVVKSIRASGGDAIFVRTDCSKAEEIKVLIDRAVAHYGRLDGVVSNAGIGMGGIPVHEYSIADYQNIFSLNSEAVFAGMKYGAEAMLRQHCKEGFLINVASIAGLMPQGGQALYTATKFGVVGMTRVAAMDYAKHNITVNAICPGYTLTSMFDDIPDEAMSFFLDDCPTGRMGKPQECAYLALFLASDMARYITGAAIPVDGALSAGHQNIMQWQHPEILTGNTINSGSTIAAIMEIPEAVVVVEKYMPGMATNKLAKKAYGMTFDKLGPLIGLKGEKLKSFLNELDAILQ